MGVFEMRSKMCEFDDHQMLTALSIMLTGDALRYLSTAIKDWQSYSAADTAIQRWYSSDEKCWRILTA